MTKATAWSQKKTNKTKQKKKEKKAVLTYLEIDHGPLSWTTILGMDRWEILISCSDMSCLPNY